MVSSRSKRFAAALETPTAALPLVLLTAAAYYATGRLGLALAIPPGYATVIWPPAGIALSAIVLGGRRLWPGVLLGSFLVNVGVQFDAGSMSTVLLSLGVPFVIGAAAVLQAITGAWLIRRFDAFPSAAVSLRSIVRLLAFGGCVASLINATIANATLLALGRIGWGEAPRAWVTWWGGDAIGVFVFAPLILGVFCAPAGERWRRAAPISAATFGAFAITVVLVVMNIGALRRDLATGFGVLSRELGAHVETTIALGGHAVGGLAGMFEGVQSRDVADFRNVANRLAAFGLGIQALEWIPRVEAANRRPFEAEMSLQWRRNYTILDLAAGEKTLAGDRPLYFPVAFVAPLEGNEGAVGVDLASDARRAAAMALAEKSGDAVATAGVRLVQNGKTGTLLFLPVFASGAPTRTETERRDALKGFALGVISVPDLLAVALHGRDMSELDYWLVDETDPSAPNILVANNPRGPAEFRIAGAGLFGADSAIGETIPLDIGGRRWAFVMAPTAAYVATHSDSSAYALLIGGLLLTGLVSGFVLVLTDRQYQLVAAREKALEDQKFALDQHAIVSITDPDGVITYANDRFCEITGYPRERLVGANHNIVHSGRQDPDFFRTLWATIRRGEVWRGEVCNRNRAGELYWLDSTIVPLLDAGGAVAQFIAICSDVTARKRLEDDLEASRAFLESVTNSMGEGVYTLDADGLCTFMNAEAERLTGWKGEEIKGRFLHDLLHFQDHTGAHIHARDCAIIQSVKIARKYQSEDQYFTHRDGRIFPVSVVAMRLEEAGQYAGSVTVFQDITERRRIQDALKKSEERLSIALDASATGLWDFYPLTDQSVYSDTWFTMLGYDPGAFPFRGATFFSLLHPDDLAAYQANMARHVSGETAAMEIEFRMRRRDGGWAWIRSVGKVIERRADGEPARISGVHIDVTAAHRVRSELAEAKDVAVRASQAKSDFLATMSHEIRTPMNAIIGLMHLLGKTEMSARQRDYVDKVQTASKSLLAIINDILDFSKIEAGKLTIERIPFRIDEVLDDVATVVAPRMREKGLELVVSRDPAMPPRLLGDPLRLSQVLMNLMSNAEKFTQRGAVRVAIGGTFVEAGQFMLELSVTDTGIGMSQEQCAALFRPFAQADASTSRRFGGTGLGLAICRQLANLFGGRIEARSEPGVGSVFTFSAPLGIAGVEDADGRGGAPFGGRAAAPRRAAEIILPDAEVLVVEDNAINQQVATELLEALGIRVTLAGSGEAAIEALSARRFDLVMMDIQMPGMDGFMTAAAIRSELGLAEMPIIAMTANAMSGDRDRCLEAGMNDHVAKPIDPEALAVTLGRWFDHVESFKPIAQSGAPGAESALRLPGIDMALALHNLNDNHPLLIRLLRELALEYGDGPVVPPEAIRDGDWARIHRDAHRLKGAAATLGATAVARIAGELEAATRPGAPARPEAAERLAGALDAAVAEVVGGLVAILPDPRAEAPAGAPLGRPDATAAAPLMDGLAALLAEGNPDAEQESEKLAALLAETTAAGRAAEVARLSGRYDFAEAMSVLARLRSELAPRG